MHHSVKRMSRFVVHFVEFPERAFGIVLMRVPIQLVKSDALRCTMQGPAWCCLHVVISRLRSLLALLSATDLNFMWCVDSWWLRWHSPPPLAGSVEPAYRNKSRTVSIAGSRNLTQSLSHSNVQQRAKELLLSELTDCTTLIKRQLGRCGSAEQRLTLIKLLSFLFSRTKGTFSSPHNQLIKHFGCVHSRSTMETSAVCMNNYTSGLEWERRSYLSKQVLPNSWSLSMNFRSTHSHGWPSQETRSPA